MIPGFVTRSGLTFRQLYERWQFMPGVRVSTKIASFFRQTGNAYAGDCQQSHFSLRGSRGISPGRDFFRADISSLETPWERGTKKPAEEAPLPVCADSYKVSV